jgi:hypothetical protein
MNMNQKIKWACFLLAAVGMVSCGGNGGENKETAEDKVVRLEGQVAEKDSLLNDVFVSLNRISENLTEIKDREGIITTDFSPEISRDQTVRITEDIAAIDRLLEQNRLQLGQLNATADRLRKADIRVKELDRLIENYTRQISEKDHDIEQLREQLSRSELLVGILNTRVDSLNADVAGLTGEKESLQGVVARQDEELNTVYYIVGSQRMLVEQGIVRRSGFVGRALSVGELADMEPLTAVDRRQLDRVIVGGLRATIVSTHPTGSYQLITDERNRLEEIRITDPERFWETSRVLIVSYR